jgi:gp16 family phage-associated protein
MLLVGVDEVKSRADVLRHFELSGMTVTSWAQEHAFNPANVYAVLAGRTHGRRGEAHRIALALGLKPRLFGITTSGLGMVSSVE